MLARFRADWGALNQSGGARYGLAVSGGPDSMALLLLAAAALPGRVAVATVDHGLRRESADEARMVAQECAALRLPHTTLTLALPAGAGVQARARAARYAALAGWARENGLAGLVTAHHADDQAETLAMRLHRGAGVRGLAGMRPVAAVPGDPTLPLLRPLLGWRRATLAAVVAQAGIAAAQDPSNDDPRFERVRVRQALGGTQDWLGSEGLAASAAHLAEADAALDWASARLFAASWQPDGEGHGGLLALDTRVPPALGLRLLERVLAALGADPAAPRGAELARWQATLAAGGVATLAGIRAQGLPDGWRFARAAPHRRT